MVHKAQYGMFVHIFLPYLVRVIRPQKIFKNTSVLEIEQLFQTHLWMLRV